MSRRLRAIVQERLAHLVPRQPSLEEIDAAICNAVRALALKLEARESMRHLASTLGAQPRSRWPLLLQRPTVQPDLLALECLAAARAHWSVEPERARGLALVVIEAAEVLDLRKSYRAVGWAYLANAERLLGALPAARASISRALEDLGDIDTWAAGEVHWLAAAVAEAGRARRAAMHHSDAAIRLFSDLNDDRSLAAAHLLQARVYENHDDIPAAQRAATAGLRHAIAAGDHRLVLGSVHSMLWYSIEAVYEGARLSKKALEQVVHWLNMAAPMYARQGNRVELAKLKWMRGRLLLCEGRTGAAREHFTESRSALDSLNRALEAAQVGLDEALSYLVDGQPLRALQRARLLRDLFESVGVPRDALAALRLETASAEHVRRALRVIAVELRRSSRKTQRDQPAGSKSPPPSP